MEPNPMDSTLGTLITLSLLAVVGIPVLVAVALLGPRRVTREAVEQLTVIWTICKVSLVTTASLALL
jgi:hypothetical protein